LKLHELLTAVGIDQSYREPMATGWDESIRSLSTAPLEMLRESVVAERHAYARLEDELLPRLISVAARIESDPALRLLLWHLYRTMYCSAGGDPNEWPQGIPLLDADAGCLYVLCALSMIPLVRDRHLALGVPPEVTRDTCLQIRDFLGNHRIGQNGEPGILVSTFGWKRKYPAGDLFRIGRLEYELVPQQFKVQVWRHNETDRPLLFMPRGFMYKDDGFRVPGENPEGGWLSTFAEDDDHVCGTVASPFGMALREPVTIEKSAWHRVIGPDDYNLNLHIPACGPLDAEACLASLRGAFDFYDRYFPDNRVSAVTCNSWIFNTQLEAHLPESNLVRFMRELYLFPVYSSGEDGLTFVFCRDYEDWSQAPRETALQRMMLDHVAAGTPLRGGGMIICRDDLEKFGQQVYRQSWPGIARDYC